MVIQAIIKTGLNSLFANKSRTGLTILGMFIGIASVVIVFSAGEGIRSLILGQVESFGTDIIQTEVKVPTGKTGTQASTQSATALAQGVQITTLKIKDMEDIKKLSNIKNGYAALTSQQQTSYGDQIKSSTIFGLSASYIDIDKSEIDIGRFYSESEDKSLSQVIVIGPKVKDRFFGNNDPLEKLIKVGKSKYRVVGVMKAKGAAFQLDYDNLIYMPVRTLQKRIMGIDHILYMVHQLKNVSKGSETAEEARLILRINHDIIAPPVDPNAAKTLGDGPTNTIKDDFRVVTMQESLAVLGTVTNAVTYLLLALVAISLVVGGVGITNILYVIVTERTQEIGLRKAVGATYRDIMLQILIESIMITVLAGLTGIVIGVIMSYFISLIAVSYGLAWKFIVPLKAYLTAIIFSLVFGVLFGLFPARKAARLNPVEALRKE